MKESNVLRIEDKIDRVSSCISAMVVRLDNLNSFKSKCEGERKDFEERVDRITNDFVRFEAKIDTSGKSIMRAIIIGISVATLMTGIMSFIFNRIEKSNLNVGLEKQVERLANIAIDNRKMIEENKKKLETPSK